MMKHYIIYLIPMLAILTACNDLNKYPKDAVNSEVYFQNESQLEQYSNQFYTLFPSAASMYNEASDEIAVAELADEIRGTRIVPTDNSGTNWNWTMLRHINYLIEHADQCPDSLVALQYVALARFFRAYLYYDRIRHYGDVPWIDRTLGSDDAVLYQPRDDRKMVMRHVMEDLDFAILYLSDDRTNVYRVNKYAAMAMKSRIALFEGTWHKYHSDESCKAFADSMLIVAYQAAEQAMNSPYQLYEEGDNSQAYRHLFTMGTVQGCSEYILARCYNKALNQYHNVNGFTLSPTTGKPGFTKRFVNQYLNADGTRFTDMSGYEKFDLGKEMTNRDPRMAQTIFRPAHYTRIGGDTLDEYKVSTSSTGYQLIKYVMDKSHDTYNQSDCDMPLIRIAEVYLNFAEAKAELDDNDHHITQADADKSINLLRRRANMPDLNVANAEANPCPYMESLYPNVSQNHKGIVLEIRRERDIELVQEGFRYWDLMRWKEGQAFEQPYLGISFAGVSKNDEDESGFIDLDDIHWDQACAWKGDKPFYPWVQYLQVNKEIVLTDSINGGNILSNGVQGNLNNGRKWNEERDYLYPIPIREITLTGGAITQNPGW